MAVSRGKRRAISTFSGLPCADVSAVAPSEGGSVGSASLQPRRRSSSATRLVVPAPISAFCFLLSTFCFCHHTLRLRRVGLARAGAGFSSPCPPEIANTANTANGAFALPPQICETLLCMHETQYAELEAQRMPLKTAQAPGSGSSVECRVSRERSSTPRPASPRVNCGLWTACPPKRRRRRVDRGPWTVDRGLWTVECGLGSVGQVYPLKWPCERESAEKRGKVWKKINKNGPAVRQPAATPADYEQL